MKVLKLEFKPEATEHRYGEYPLASDLVEEFEIRSFKLNNIQEFHLLGVDLGESKFKDLLEPITEIFPKLQRLCLAFQVVPFSWDKICQAFASEKNIKLEISTAGTKVCLLFREMKIFHPR